MAADINSIYEEVTALETYAIPNDGDASDVTAAFTQASTRANLTSGEKLKISLGKLMKWFADLKTVAFTGSYSDLSDKPSGTGSGSIVDLGTFNDETELITHAVMNQLPTGHYSFIMNDYPYLMPLKDNDTFYTGVFFNSEGDYVSFSVLKNGEVVNRDILELDKVNSTVLSIVEAIDIALTNIGQLMPLSGGTLENYAEKLTTVSASGGIINLSLGNVFQHSPSGNRTYSITNAVNGQAYSFTLIVNMGSTVRTLTFPASVKWQGGEIPDLTTASKTYVLTFMSVDGGTTWLGMFGGEF
jgi:hypothetical protein